MRKEKTKICTECCESKPLDVFKPKPRANGDIYYSHICNHCLYVRYKDGVAGNSPTPLLLDVNDKRAMNFIKEMRKYGF